MLQINSLTPSESLPPVQNIAPSQKEKIDNPSPIQDKVTISDSKPAGEKMVKVRVYTQDPSVGGGETEIIEIEESKIGKDLRSPKMLAANNEDNPNAAIADEDGNYLYTPTDPQFTKVNAFVAASKTSDIFDNFIGHETSWDFKGPITINTDIQNPGAFYSRYYKSVNLGFYDSKSMNRTIRTGDSTEVTSHETAHAKFYGMRPFYEKDYWSKEKTAYCEAVADIGSMITILHSEKNLSEIIKETGGDLKKNNRLSIIGEEYGAAFHLDDNNPKNDSENYIRNVHNNFKYISIEKVPFDDGNEKFSPNELTSECHSFSRILSGAFYDSLAEGFNKFLGKDPASASQEEMIEALEKSRDVMGRVFVKSMELTPPSGITFTQAASTILAADKMLNNGENTDILQKVFLERNLICADDLKSLDEDGKKLAQVKLTENLTYKEEALTFLLKNQSKIGATCGDYNKAKIITDKYGNTILEYSIGRDLTFPNMGPHHSPAKVEAYDGLTLGFDKDGKLISSQEYRINKDDIIRHLAYEDPIDYEEVKEEEKPA